ncbi:GNAT family acetyltransferase [Moellerella wisconsensis]|uniref:YpeA family acetyltransferase n=3 Tax=Moellerella wisconsensis TaxID=158849 RepID=A0A0N0ZB73_9GAMM|nr:GNAT family acetyltransferase [Moellerella wisconsensis]KLN96813.1 acetyltransferase [Moellerella wisconsensis]KPD03044.1 YpeA family acetyltransferase [Moellerella wisconsensis ATCC 35017]UNH23258.1 GNAT family acetyltransferase [Moellerella wisconsensis]UNH26336.1 GNAT family acetyltransferase [Moellerella wisconsensis]UNH29750.1 GNAT family acetyltransferase [Moellerella wisconsensis]
MEIRIFRQGDFEDVLMLWERCELNEFGYDPELIIERKLQCGADLFLVAEVTGEIVGTVMGGYDGVRGRAYYLAVHPEYRGRGIANALISRLEKKLLAQGCPVIELLVNEEYDSAICMFEKMEYEDEQPARLIYNKRLNDGTAF